jgi:hypothetical protein
MHDFHKRGIGRVLLAATVLGLTACSEDGQVTLPTEVTPDPAVSAEATRQEAAVRDLTRALAVALQDPGLRERIKSDMRNAPWVEHKLQFQAYLRSQSGAVLLAEMAQATGKTPEEILALAGAVESLEFYMPVSEHRQSWVGGDDLLVASALEEDAITAAYDLQGQPVALSATVAPERPTLVLVPVEIDFSQPLDLSQFENVHDQGGAAIGTLMPKGLHAGGHTHRSQANQSGIPGPLFSDIPTISDSEVTCDDDPSYVCYRGLGVEERISYMKAPTDHEPWPKGNPEFRLRLTATTKDGTEYVWRHNIPESIWAGDSNTHNGHWRPVGGNGLELIMWNQDYGTNVKVGCVEIDDLDYNFSLTLSGSSSFPTDDTNSSFTSVDFSYKFALEFDDDDDFCGESYIYPRVADSTYRWTNVPGSDNNPDDGTSDLQWKGFGLQQ